eukprot:gnl/Chilomastix_caulleri/1761.p1 GENE.gnl/Chilomastix_caulleri/1761~~gnl/Chilomastix_caulleri/1761.p1  ORF type:complete len:215 (+),score=51.74 gnl/Chilomastix_caulleri/1761:127-771(+)
MYKAKSAGYIQRASDNTFQEEVRHILSDIIGLNDISHEKQEQLKVDIQGVRIVNNMDHQDCLPAIILAALQLSYGKCGESAEELLAENIRLLELFWPLMDCYITTDMRESQSHSIELLYGVFNFVSGLVRDDEWENWALYVSSLFQLLWNSESDIACDEDTFIAFFEELDESRDERQIAFSEICRGFREWLLASSDDEEYEEGEEEYEEDENEK